MYTKIVNNTLSEIVLPPNPMFPAGFKLICGSNNVPDEYLESIKDFKVPFIGANGSRTRIKLLDDLASPSKASGGKPRVQVMGTITPDAPTGPDAPHDLNDYKEPLALKIIAVTTDKVALERWANLQSHSTELRAAANARAQLGGVS